MSLTEEQKKEIARVYGSGIGIQITARQLGLAERAVTDYVRESGIMRTRKEGLVLGRARVKRGKSNQ